MSLCTCLLLLRWLLLLLGLLLWCWVLWMLLPYERRLLLLLRLSLRVEDLLLLGLFQLLLVLLLVGHDHLRSIRTIAHCLPADNELRPAQAPNRICIIKTYLV